MDHNLYSQPIAELLSRLWKHISPRRRSQFGLLLVLMIFASFAEILSIGTIMPFLAILTNPEHVFVHPSYQIIIRQLGITEPSQLLLPLTIAFSLSALLAGILRLLLLWASTRISFATGTDLSISIYLRTLFQPFSTHAARNSSEVINGISTKSNGVIYGIIFPTMNLISSAFMLIAILIALLSVNTIIAVSAFGGFGLIYALVIWMTRSRLYANSQVVARESNNVMKSLQEGLGGIRDVLIDGNQVTYCQIYYNADHLFRRAQGSNLFISSSPRYGVEALGMLLIAALAYTLAKEVDGLAQAIPTLGALALGAQRLLPALQQAYGSLSLILGGQASLNDTLNLLDQPLPDYADQSDVKPLAFINQINLKKVSFRYSSQTPWVLTNLDLTIMKGSKVGFIGLTGSGKSTLIDIIMGLLEPTVGSLEVDGRNIFGSNLRAWQTNIAHVPQAIFLADSTIEENIAFGVPKDKIDSLRVRQAAQKAQIAESIESWPNRYQTFVGERGIRLSGGQRQRIGIARAFYKQANIIIFDEATSALDSETEQAVMQSIEGVSKDLTLLIIAHRLTTLKNCTQIVELGENGIKRIGSYQEMVAGGI